MIIDLANVRFPSLIIGALKENENQLMIWGFTEFRTNKKNENMTFLMKILQGLVLWRILQGLMLKHVYILLILNFPLNMQAAISHLSVT
jgi:hypothetical protein